MRITYWDDCGMFNADQEPFVVVGAAIINVDNQYRPLADSLDALRNLSTTLRHSPLQFTVQDLLSLDWVG